MFSLQMQHYAMSMINKYGKLKIQVSHVYGKLIFVTHETLM